MGGWEDNQREGKITGEPGLREKQYIKGNQK